MAFIGKQPSLNRTKYTPLSATPSNPEEGDVFYSDGTALAEGLYVYKNGVWQTVGASGVDLNYIIDGDAEAGVSNYNTYADAAGERPVDGEGGSPTITFTQSSTDPLRGVNSFVLTKDAANRQGEGVARDFVIDDADLASMLTISFDASTSANYADGDVRVYMISSSDNFAADFNVIEPVPTELYAGNGQFKVQFQTEASDVDYRLCLHVASTNATAYTVKIDNIRVERSSTTFGVPASDWQSYTPTSSWVANTTVTGKYRRVGDSLEVEANLDLSGAPTSAELTVTIPSGLSIDTNKVTNTATYENSLGTATLFDSGVRIYVAGIIYGDQTTVRVSHSEATNAGIVSATSPFSFGASDSVTLKFKVPIAGWSSNTLMSDDADTRTISMIGYLGTNESIPDSTNSVLNNIVTTEDTHAAFDAANGKYVVPVSGFYEVKYLSNLQNNSTGIRLYRIQVGGMDYDICADTNPSAGNFSQASGSRTFRFNKGDEVFFTCFQTSGVALTFNASATASGFSVAKISGPSQIAASEKVYAECNTNASPVIGTSATIVQYNTVVEDTHNAITTGSSWKFTAPKSGIYEVKAFIQAANATTGSGTLEMSVWKNGTRNKASTIHVLSAQSQEVLGCFAIKLNQGDYIDLRALLQNSSPLFNQPEYNWVTIQSQ